MPFTSGKGKSAVRCICTMQYMSPLLNEVTDSTTALSNTGIDYSAMCPIKAVLIYFVGQRVARGGTARKWCKRKLYGVIVRPLRICQNTSVKEQIK